MSSNKDMQDIPMSPMMTEQGREELYLYSLKKMAQINADKNKINLTNLYGGKPFFFKANECMLEHSELQYALIRMDIYRFKTVNEFCGRQQGDKLLQYIADCFRVYESDTTIVGHLRADIFAICIPFEDKQELIDIVTSLHKKNMCIPAFLQSASGIWNLYFQQSYGYQFDV